MDTDDTIYLDLPATYQYLNMLSACIGEMLARVNGLREPQIIAYNVQLAAQEICTNIVSHAYNGQPNPRIKVTLGVAQAPYRLEIELRDCGRPFEPAGVPEPDLDNLQIHGYGLFLARSLMDTVEYTRLSDCNRWRLIKLLEEG